CSPPSFGGLILSRTLSEQQYRGMAVLTPVICGVGGNLVAIQSSRISTYLHVRSTPGVLPLPMKGSCPRPWATFCSPEINSTSARVLLLLVVPGHLLFFYVIRLVEGPAVASSRTFVLLYLLASLVQVRTLTSARAHWVRPQALSPALGSHGLCSVAEAGLQLAILLPQPPELLGCQAWATGQADCDVLIQIMAEGVGQGL
uniref:Solute carrier family 41 member n=1 Tax=Marmota marmota marmota TaxID=9994 RepID=A0A8C5ZDG7_MARMA